VPANPHPDEDASTIVRGFEIFADNESKFRSIAQELIEKDFVTFVFLGKRIILTTYGLSYNMGFNLETEDLDGTQRFKSGWCYYPDNYEDRITEITTAVSILAAEIESAAPIK